MTTSEIQDRITYPVLVNDEWLYPSSWKCNQPLDREKIQEYNRIVDDYFSWLAMQPRIIF